MLQGVANDSSCSVFLDVADEVCIRGSSVILWPVWKLSDHILRIVRVWHRFFNKMCECTSAHSYVKWNILIHLMSVTSCTSQD